MKRSWTVIFSVACVGFIAGLLVTLALHRQIRPDTNAELQPEINVTEQITPVSTDEFEQVKLELNRAETQYAKAKEAHRITEGHARALVSEMQVYRNSESELLQSIEQQKVALTEKIETLNTRITQTIEQSAQLPRAFDYEQINEITALLAYPHPLNNNPIINRALTEQPELGLALVNDRFEIMLQPEHFPHTDAAYDALEELIARLPEGSPEISIDNVFCSEWQCELQFSVSKPSPYFDSWRWLLDQLSAEPSLVTIQNSFHVETAQTASGFVMLETGR